MFLNHLGLNFNDFSCFLDPSVSKWACVVDHCELETPCLHNATCRPTRDSFICECEIGFSGRRCEVDIDECQTQRPCKNHGICVNQDGSFRCECPAGFGGNLCEQRIGFCVQNPCGTHGNCVDEDAEYRCNCEPGWTGKNCESEAAEICECENPNHECILKNGKPACECPSGTQGSRCDEPIDLCASENKCANGGQCIANGNSTFCICPSQFTGTFCESRIADCLVDEKPCLNGGKCLRSDESNGVENRCECVGRFMGRWCEQMRLSAHLNSTAGVPRQCPKNFCKNGGKQIRQTNSPSWFYVEFLGKCKLEKGHPKCECLNFGFTGEKCEKRVAPDLCNPNPCLNDGQCHSNGTALSCFCLENFTGSRCEIPCECGPNELCRESIRTPGSAECLTVPEPEIIIPDNTPVDFPLETTNELLETTTLVIQPIPTTKTSTNFPLPPLTLLTQNNDTEVTYPSTVSFVARPITSTSKPSLTPSSSPTIQPSPTPSSATEITESFDELLVSFEFRYPSSFHFHQKCFYLKFTNLHINFFRM